MGEAQLETIQTKIEALEVKIAGIEAEIGGGPVKFLERLISDGWEVDQAKGLLVELFKAKVKEKEHLHEEKILLLRSQVESVTKEDSARAVTKEDIAPLLRWVHDKEGSISLSKVTNGHWAKVAGKSGIQVVPYLEPLPHVPPQPAENFPWDSRMEKSQSDRYIPWIVKQLNANTPLVEQGPAVRNQGDPSLLKLVDSGGLKTLFDIEEEDILGFTKVKGAPDAIVVEDEAYRNHVQSSILAVFVFKKQQPPPNESNAVSQTLLSLVVANLLSPRTRPFAVLTNLQDYYSFYWMDGHMLYTRSVDPRLAWAIAIELLEAAHSGGMGRRSSPLRPIVNRKPMEVRKHDTEDINDLADFEGFEDGSNFGEHLHACNARAVQLLLKVPFIAPHLLKIAQ